MRGKERGECLSEDGVRGADSEKSGVVVAKQSSHFTPSNCERKKLGAGADQRALLAV